MDSQLLVRSLFALLIGINDYSATRANNEPPPASDLRGSLDFHNLKGAIPDVTSFKEYLLNALQVDESNITMLLDKHATRVNIIDAFQKLANNDRIKKDDSIFIFYAGHGARALPPTRLAQIAGCPEQIEVIIPYDFLQNSKDHRHMAIPDFTLAVLIDRISKEKGNHIVRPAITDICICEIDLKCRRLLSIVATLHRLQEGSLPISTPKR